MGKVIFYDTLQARNSLARNGHNLVTEWSQTINN